MFVFAKMQNEANEYIWLQANKAIERKRIKIDACTISPSKNSVHLEKYRTFT